MISLLGLSTVATTLIIVAACVVAVVGFGLLGYFLIVPKRKQRQATLATQADETAAQAEDQGSGTTTTKQKKYRSMRAKNITVLTIIHVVLTVLAIIWVLPFVYILLHSFRGNNIDQAFPADFLPTQWSFDAWSKMLGGSPEAFSDARFDWIDFRRWWLNTFIVACCSCILSTMMTLMTSYAFSRMRFKLRQPYMKLILILGMFPGFLGMIAVYKLLEAVELNKGILKLVALVFVYSGGAGMGYYVSKGFFDTIPRALDESAMLDGASQAHIFLKITLPLSKPIIVYTALTAFMGPWMDFIFVRLICMGDYNYGTVSLGLQEMLSQNNLSTHWVLFCAGATMVAIPITVLFMFLQKYYVSGVTGGAVKG